MITKRKGLKKINGSAQRTAGTFVPKCKTQLQKCLFASESCMLFCAVFALVTSFYAATFQLYNKMNEHERFL